MGRGRAGAVILPIVRGGRRFESDDGRDKPKLSCCNIIVLCNALGFGPIWIVLRADSDVNKLHDPHLTITPICSSKLCYCNCTFFGLTIPQGNRRADLSKSTVHRLPLHPPDRCLDRDQTRTAMLIS